MNETQRHGAAIEEADPDTTSTLLVVVVGTILIVAVVVFVQGLYGRATRSEFERKVVAEAPAELQRLRADQLMRLSGLTWVDRREGIVTIPIEDAMRMVIREAGAPPPGGAAR